MASFATFTASDGYRFQYRKFAAQPLLALRAPDQSSEPAAQARVPIRGRVIFIHGIQSHGGWYTRSCAKIAAAGYEVYFPDRRGSGLNTERRGDIPTFRRVLDDYGEFIQSLPQDGLPKFLGAISWGGKFGVGMQYRFPGLVDGLALLCPGIVSKVRQSFFERMRVVAARLVRPTRLFPIPLNDPTLFTSSLEWQRFLKEDPLALHHATARLMFWSRALDIYLRRAWKRVNLPVLLMLAEKDAIIDNDAVRAYVEKFPSTDKQVVIYPGAYHTLEFEALDHSWLKDVLAWLEKQSSQAKR